MNHTINARLYFLFALALLAFAWKIGKAGKEQIAVAQAARSAALERMISANE